MCNTRSFFLLAVENQRATLLGIIAFTFHFNSWEFYPERPSGHDVVIGVSPSHLSPLGLAFMFIAQKFTVPTAHRFPTIGVHTDTDQSRPLERLGAVRL